MSAACPSCGAAMASNDPICPSCGQEKAPARPAPAKSDDALQYVKIIGIMVVVVVVVLIVAGMMGPGAQPCNDCKGRKVTICTNCEDGRNRCKICQGRGFDPQHFGTCSNCQGKGETASCWKCGGKPKQTCKTCKGTGIQPE